MNRLRYADKKILCGYDLDENLFKLLGVEAEDLIPLRKVFVVVSNKGKKILKYTEVNDERIEFIDTALNYVRDRDKNVLNYCRNLNGDLITKWKEKKYILLNLVEGREATFTNPVEVSLCAEALAKMHNSSIGIEGTLTKETFEKNKGRNFIERMKEEKEFIIQCKRIVSKFKYKNEFDLLFLNNVDDEYKDLCNTIELMEQGAYNDIYKQDKVLCHNDLAHHNFMISNENVNIIDFDYCDINPRIDDIYNFTNKVLKTVAYDKEFIKIIVDSYSKESQLSDKEIEVLKQMLNYPKDFIALVKNYYLKQKSWEEAVFINRMKEKLELEIYKRNMK